MKKLTVLALLIVSVCLQSSVPADFATHWVFLYNDKAINDCYEYRKGCDISLKLDSIEPTDTLSIIYSDDTPCSTCYFFIKDDKSKYWKDVFVKKQGPSFEIKLSGLLVKHIVQSYGSKRYVIYNTDYKWPLFNIEFK